LKQRGDFFSVCSDRKREVELYYGIGLATDLSAIHQDKLTFQECCLEAFATVPKSSVLSDGNLSQSLNHSLNINNVWNILRGRAPKSVTKVVETLLSSESTKRTMIGNEFRECR
jgi:hypothetical protein